MDYKAAKTALKTVKATPKTGGAYPAVGGRASEVGYGGGSGGGAAEYAATTNRLASDHAQDMAGRKYQQYIGAEGFRRNREDAGLQFKRTFPKVGSAFNRRGMWNSGMRKHGQNEFVGDYKRDVGRVNWDQGAYDQGFALQQAQANANYQSALQTAYDSFQTKRAGADPFAAIRSKGL